MKKITKAQIEELTKKAMLSGNPYKKQATQYFVGNQEMFLRYGEKYTAEELDAAYMETAQKDIVNGYNERGVGYYDKWYRYNRADEGRAYDLGVRLAAGTSGCQEDFRIIEC